MNNPKAFIYNEGALTGSESWVGKIIYGQELMGMRLLRKKSKKEMAKVIDKSVNFIDAMESTDRIPVLSDVAGAYMKYLNCNYNHVMQFRKIIDGETNEFTESRYISTKMRKDVFDKCDNACTSCGSEDKLHIHHIKRYADGGFTDLKNLTLLCALCHANEHKGEKAYKMLLKISEE